MTDTSALHALADYAARLSTTPESRTDSALENLARDAAAIAGGEYRPAYNGWTNRETWNAALWIDNDQPSYNAARGIVRAAFDEYEEPELLAHVRQDDPPEKRAADRRVGATRDAADALRDWYEETFGPEDTGSALGDAWTYAVGVADWYRIAEGYAEDLPDPGTETNDDPDPRCDICGRAMDDSPAGFADADWNPETGNHETCETVR